MHEWLEQARARLAASVGDGASDYVLSDALVHDLLDLARVAAHESGDRTNAPLICYLVGIAHARHPERKLADFVDDVVGKR
jgi:hypothetical protein